MLCDSLFFGRGGKVGWLLFRSHERKRTLSPDLGAAYGTAKSGVGIAAAGVMKPDAIMKSIIPVVMAGILGIYGLIIAVIIGTKS